MSKFWFGSLEQILDQHDEKGHLKPTAVKAVKGWKIEAEEYATDREKIEARNKQAEIWWADAEGWWASQQVNKDIKGETTSHNLDYQPIRETGDFQLRITGPVDVPDEPDEPVEEAKPAKKHEYAKGAKL